MKINECIFCTIIEDKHKLIYEDEQTVAFLDLYPVEKAHTLVIPKNHTRTWLESDETVVMATMKTAHKIAKKLKTIFPGIKGYNILINNGPEAGQKVYHYHLHILPKFNKDQGYQVRHHIDENEMRKVQATLTYIKEKWS